MRLGLEIEKLATGKITPKKISEWEAGKDLPSETQAETLAAKLGIPYAMLFMAAPPKRDDLNIPDLRTISGQPLVNPTLDFLEVLTDTVARQDWYRSERLDEVPKKLAFVGKFTLADDPIAVAADMRSVLHLSTQERVDAHTYEDFLKKFIENAEKSGVLVMRSAVVRHITSRPLRVEEFRGFALNDGIAPVVFINDADAKAAQIFTLAHELAHIWIGEDGVSDRQPNEKKNSANAIELFCDRVAAEVLVPEAEFRKQWRGARSTEQNYIVVARYFKVSSLVALRRAKDLNHISLQTFIQAVDEQYEKFRRIDAQKREKQKNAEKKGGNFWASFDLRNSATFNAAVVSALRSQKATYTEAASLLGLNLGSTVRYLKRVGVKG